MCVFSLQAFANMTANIRRELCAVMLFAVVEHANVVVLNDGDQVRKLYFALEYTLIIE